MRMAIHLSGMYFQSVICEMSLHNQAPMNITSCIETSVPRVNMSKVNTRQPVHSLGVALMYLTRSYRTITSLIRASKWNKIVSVLVVS